MSRIEPQQARSQQTLNKILAACTTLLAERSFEKISMQDIAREAGVSVGNLYNRFQDKDALVNSVVAAHQIAMLETTRSELSAVTAETLKDRLDQMTDVVANKMEPVRPLLITLAARQANSIEELTPDVRDNTDALVDELTDWLIASDSSLDRTKTRFAVASIAFGLQFDVIFRTPTRLFGPHYRNALSEQAYAYITQEDSK